MRLILFDIDGTLIYAHGVGHRSFVRAMESVFGTAGPHDTYDWRGKTDPWILRDLMRLAGVPDDVLDARLGECFESYARFLEALLADGHPVDVLPGIDRLVRAPAAREDVLLGLLTGNVKPGAEAKLRSTGLLPFFRLGAYGSDDADRRRLPAIARERARALTGSRSPSPTPSLSGTPRSTWTAAGPAAPWLWRSRPASIPCRSSRRSSRISCFRTSATWRGACSGC